MKLKKNFGLRAFLILLVAVAVSCRGNGTTQVAEFSDQAQTLPPIITIVNWNAQKGSNPQFASDLKLLLEQEKPDIVFLQEARAGIFEPETMGGYFAEAWHYPWPDGKTIGVLTLSRVPPVRVQSVSSKYREFRVTAPKVSLVTEFPLSNGENLMAVNVHLLNFERWSVKKIRHQLEDLKSIMANHSGPILMAGMGGTLVELLKDVSVRIHPLTDVDVDEMLRSLRGWPLLSGYRGSPPLDVEALQRLLFRVSEMVEEVPEIDELDLNPVFVRRRGIAAVDARIKLSSGHTPPHR